MSPVIRDGSSDSTFGMIKIFEKYSAVPSKVQEALAFKIVVHRCMRD